MDFNLVLYCIPIAFLLDLIFGDPAFFPHPVRLMGKAIERLEPCFRKIPINLTLSGVLFSLLLISGTWILTWGTLKAAGSIHFMLKAVLYVLMIYYCISARCLEESAMAVYKELKCGNINNAKEKISMIVGRDVQKLSETGITRAAVETVAENLVDGVISPLFYAAIGGAPLAMAYKMVNTLDSMIGYKNETYIHFGKGAARIDDAANFIPARLSVFIIALAAQLFCKRGAEALKTGMLEGANHASPNSGYSEAAFAGTLKIKLGGPNYYHGNLVNKPWIGTKFTIEPGYEQIKTACNLMILSAFIFMITAWGISVLIYFAKNYT